MSSDGFEFDEVDLGELDAIESHYTHGTALPPRSAVNRPGLVQRDLFGAAVVPAPRPPATTKPAAAGGGGLSRTITIGGGSSQGGGFEPTQAKTKVTKKWDPAAFAKHGWSKKNAAVTKAKAKGGKGKGKQKAYASDEDARDEDEVLDDDDDDDDDLDGREELLDTTYDPKAPILPIKWPPDREASKSFVYPVQADKPLRTYQYNIVTSALYKNTLVSLPTGLGKTFIAACVMLNFYRWYPKGKVLFLAPTRPLVTQQIKACHYIAGIPQEDCIELTGGTVPKLRSLGWATKRVIYSTPQTVERDLAKGRLDPRDVTLVVVDEAHRASGDYSYCGVIRYMMCRNPHFRVLALTATPGSRGEAVQEVIDNLHIGHIEVRADDSFDIRQYVHKKSFDLTILPLGPALSALRDKWAALMRPYIGPLLEKRLIYQGDAVMLSPFVVQQAYQKIKALPGGGKSNGQYFPMIKTLGQMCRAMEYLVIQSVTSFESSLKDIQANGAKKLVQSTGFKQVVSEVAAIRGREGYVGHPKMEKLRAMCLEHFEATKDDVDEYTGEKRETRVMIFCNFRAVVEEIVDCLNTQRPLIKATPFVGQASSKGTKGKSQKEQLETIKKFKKGVYNVLVATSIGEEGLDIGEIDLIICYEANKSPIRMLQRVGRTGRARDGHIIVLMSEGREERNWDRANDAYQEVQNALTSNKIFELYADCERLLPDDVKPVCEKAEIKALPLNTDAMTMNGQSRAERKHLAEEKKKGKSVRDPRANMPDDAFEGFRTAGQLAAAKKAKPPTATQTVRERKADALLDTEQEEHLRTRWMYDVTGQPVIPERFFTDELPFERNSSGSAQRITRHGQRHLDLLSALHTNEQLADGNRRALDAWTDTLSQAFKPNLIDVYKRGDDDPLPRPHPRLRRIRPEEDENEVPPALVFPALTGYPMPRPFTSPHSSAISAKDQPLFRPSSPRTSPPKRSSDHVSPRISSPARKRARLPSDSVAQERSDGHQAVTETIDLSGVLSSDDEDLAALRQSSTSHQSQIRAPAPIAGHDPSSTSYSVELGDDDDMAMDWSDSELLKGAVIRGKSGSISPRPAKEEPIVIDDSEDDFGPHSQPHRAQVVPAPTAPRKPPPPVSVLASSKPKLAAGPPPSRTVSAPSFGPIVPSARDSSSPALGRTKSASNVRGPGAAAFKPFIPPRPSKSQPSTSSPHIAPSRARPSSPPLRSSPPPVIVLEDSPEAYPPHLSAGAIRDQRVPLPVEEEVDDDDEYGSFDLPAEAFDEFNVSQIPTAKIRGRPLAAQVAPALEDDSIIMPPPPPSVKRRPPGTTAGTTTASKRKLVVPTSSSDGVAAPRSPRSSHLAAPGTNATGFRPAKTLLPPELVAANSKSRKTAARVVESAPQPAPMRRLAVPDSSSPAVASGSLYGGGAGALVRKNAVVPRREEDEQDDVEIVSPDLPARALNRLRRGGGGGGGGKDVVGSDEEDAVGGRGGARAEERLPKQKTKKKEILTHKAAAKFGIFDTEAINSEAEGSEASSESYDSENSIDRDFVARDDEDVEGEGNTFYRDSLNTQYDDGGAGPGRGRGPVFETEPEWVRKRNRWANPENWGKHRQHERRASVQDTPRSQEPSQWSYDSFCVPDDEEIEYDQSQENGGYSSPV
ncbi:hypothetical protein JCM11491_000667 [Sporobolomyces phaffii]